MCAVYGCARVLSCDIETNKQKKLYCVHKLIDGNIPKQTQMLKCYILSITTTTYTRARNLYVIINIIWLNTSWYDTSQLTQNTYGNELLPVILKPLQTPRCCMYKIQIQGHK